MKLKISGHTAFCVWRYRLKIWQHNFQTLCHSPMCVKADEKRESMNNDHSKGYKEDHAKINLAVTIAALSALVSAHQHSAAAFPSHSNSKFIRPFHRHIPDINRANCRPHRDTAEQEVHFNQPSGILDWTGNMRGQ